MVVEDLNGVKGWVETLNGVDCFYSEGAGMYYGCCSWGWMGRAMSREVGGYGRHALSRVSG